MFNVSKPKTLTRKPFDKCWDIANKAFKETGNWGNVRSGVKTRYALATTWGGYGLIEFEDAEAFNEYQMFHVQNYGHAFDITLNPVGDLAVMMPDIYGK